MVSRLTRVRFGPITLPRNLRQGKWQDMDTSDQNTIYKLVDMKPGATSRPGQGQRPKRRR